MKKLLIVTDNLFPKGSALASRLISFCRLFKDLGYDIHVITARSVDKTNVDKIIDNKDYTYEVVSTNRSDRLQSFIGNENLVKRVDNYLKNNKVDLVFSTSLNTTFSKVLKVVKKYNKKIILEQCEWLDSSSFGLGKFDPRFIMTRLNLTKHYLKVNGVISISRLLDDYYKEKGVKTIRIPSIIDAKNREFNLNSNKEYIRLVYTGNASKSKELLKPIVEALASNEEFINNYKFDIYGLNENQYFNNIGRDDMLIEKTNNCVTVHGTVDQKKIEDILLNSDFQIFIRPNRKSSNAGFPTKLCESMSSGTPVISNITGDIGLYLKDGYNGYVSNGIDKESIIAVFDKVLKNKDLNTMRKNARETALNGFDYSNYLDEVKELIEKL